MSTVGCDMAWKATGQPTVREQRDKWVVRVDGIDTATGKHRPRQLGTYASQRSALSAAHSMRAGLPRLTSHGLRHTAATHMVQSSNDLGELRAIADLLGHSPEMLMNTYAHALPNSQAAVVDRLRRDR
jgi:integrase